jgi:hypothetical protein
VPPQARVWRQGQEKVVVVVVVVVEVAGGLAGWKGKQGCDAMLS